VGFSRAVASIATAPSDAAVVRTKTVAIGTCDDLTPENATVDLPLDSTRCLRGSQQASFVLGPNDEGSALNTSDLAEGTYYRRVTVYDAAGNAGDLLKSATSDWEAFEVWHPVLGSATQTLSIGSGSVLGDQPQANANRTNGTKGSQATSCSSPRLSVSLRQKPVRVTKTVVVLQSGKRYRFEGRLSCLVNRRRVSAPKRTKLQLLNRVGKRTVTKTGPRIATKGRFKISLKYPKGSRTLIFRYTSPNKQRSQVSIKIKVEKKKKASRKR